MVSLHHVATFYIYTCALLVSKLSGCLIRQTNICSIISNMHMQMRLANLFAGIGSRHMTWLAYSMHMLLTLQQGSFKLKL